MNTEPENIIYDNEIKYIIDTLNDCTLKGHLYYVHAKRVISYVSNKLEKEGFIVKKHKNYTYVCRKESKNKAFKQLSWHLPKK